MLTRIVLTLIAAQITFAAVNYSYDPAGRLARIDYGALGSINYTYDKSGNLLSRATQGAAGAGTITSVNTAGGGGDITQNDWIEIKGSGIAPGQHSRQLASSGTTRRSSPPAACPHSSKGSASPSTASPPTCTSIAADRSPVPSAPRTRSTCSRLWTPQKAP